MQIVGYTSLRILRSWRLEYLNFRIKDKNQEFCFRAEGGIIQGILHIYHSSVLVTDEETMYYIIVRQDIIQIFRL
jgi:hypothetical protein